MSERPFLVTVSVPGATGRLEARTIERPGRLNQIIYGLREPVTKLLEIERVEATPPGRGAGTQLLTEATALFDKLQVWAVLERAQLFGAPHVDAARLLRFYARFGFVPGLHERLMYRRPDLAPRA